MIKQFLVERLSWIIFFLIIQFLFIFIAYIDPTLPLKSMLYITFLFMIFFIGFLIIRYQKETKFYKSLEEWDHHLDIMSIIEPASPFETIVKSSIVNQTEILKRKINEDQVALERERDELLSWIHEVKTPLTAMHLMVERLPDQKIQAELTYEWLRIHLLLDQQLHQKRMGFIENDLHFEKVALEPLIFKEIKDLQSWCMQKGIGFEVNLEVTEVLSDVKWLAFIMRQLLTNGVKYSSHTEILIESRMENGRIVIDVKNFGRGINPKDLPRIFEKGFTSTTHQNHTATGMGLYLAKKAAKPLGIHISVQSTVDVGTIFTLTFSKLNEFTHLAGM